MVAEAAQRERSLLERERLERVMAEQARATELARREHMSTQRNAYAGQGAWEAV